MAFYRDLIDPENVYGHIPAMVKRPADTLKESDPAGVTERGYQNLLRGVILEIVSRLTTDEVEVGLPVVLEGVTYLLGEHPLLIDALEIHLAARILRRLRNYQEVADSLFADYNVKYRLYLEGVARTGGSDAGGIESVVMDVAPDPYLPEPKNWTEGFLPRKRVLG